MAIIRDDLKEQLRILAGIIGRAPSGRLDNKTHLFKAYYWAHLYYWTKSKGALTRRHSIIHMPKGPGIDRHRELIERLGSDGLADVNIEHFGQGDSQYRFRSLTSIELTKEEAEAIDFGLNKVAGKSTGKVSKESHGRSWDATTDGQPMDIYQDALTEDEVREIDASLDITEQAIGAIFRKK